MKKINKKQPFVRKQEHVFVYSGQTDSCSCCRDEFITTLQEWISWNFGEVTKGLWVSGRIKVTIELLDSESK